MNNKAFSLIELLVVVAIIAILAAIAFPQYNKFRANAFYGKMETNLKTARLWAENVFHDYDKYPAGICDASNLKSGTLKCSYDATNDTIIVDSNGDLKVDAPFKVTFERSSCQDGSPGVKITIECPSGLCSGLEPAEGQNAKLWVDSCENPEKVHALTSLFNN